MIKPLYISRAAFEKLFSPKLPRRTVDRWIKTQKLGTPRKMGKNTYFKVKEIERFMGAPLEKGQLS